MVMLLTSALDDFPDSPWGGGQHAGLIQAHAANVDYVEAVHVFIRAHCVTHTPLVNMLCEIER